eukprot:g16787.t1
MPPTLGYQGILALELLLVWASFSPIFPLLTAPRRDGHEEKSVPSPAPRLLLAALTTAAVTYATASTVVMVAAGRKTGTSAGRTAATSPGLRGRGKDGSGRGAAFRGVIGLMAGACVIHAVAIVLGAPILRRAPETAVFSLLMASLTTLPVSVSSPWPLEACAGFLRGTRPAVHVPGTMVPAAGCALGAWLGAIPLCLDWEQPWQGWPLPMCAGGLLGFSLGCLLLLGAEAAEIVRRNFSFWRGTDKQA